MSDIKSSKLLIHEYPLQVLPSLAKAIGLNEAIVLQQLHYWIDNPKNEGIIRDGYKWVYNTYEEWKKDNFPFWSEATIQRAFLELERLGLIKSEQFFKNKHDMKKFYRIDYDAIDAMERSKLLPSDNSNLQPSNTSSCRDVNTETTSETKTKNTAKNLPPKKQAGRTAKNPAQPRLIQDDQVEPKSPPEHAVMFGMIAKICVLNEKLMGGRIGKTARQLREAGYTIQDLETFDTWWKADFRGRDGKSPSLASVIECIEKAKKESPAPVAPKKKTRQIEHRGPNGELLLEEVEVNE